LPAGLVALRIEVKGLKGGHSGDEIHKGHGNSVKILNRILWHASDEFEMRISHIDAGNLRNAIPREAVADVCIPAVHEKEFTKYVKNFYNDAKLELSVTAPELSITVKPAGEQKFVIDENTQYNLVNALYACPHGVISWSQSLEGLVETSTNLASVKFVENNRIMVTTSQRSSLNSGKEDIANMVESVFVLAGADVVHSEGYPGWNPNPNSDILKIAETTYQKLFKKKPVVRAIHAGLECGLFLEKYPGLDMISIGPTLRGVHSPDEKINIKTVEMWWNHLLEILKNIPR